MAGWLAICTGKLKNIYFPFVPNGKLMVFGIPIFNHIRILTTSSPRLPNFSVASNQSDNLLNFDLKYKCIQLPYLFDYKTSFSSL